MKRIILLTFIFVVLASLSLGLEDEDQDFYLEDSDISETHPSYDHCLGSQINATVDNYGCDCEQKTSGDCEGEWCCNEKQACVVENGQAQCMYIEYVGKEDECSANDVRCKDELSCKEDLYTTFGQMNSSICCQHQKECAMDSVCVQEGTTTKACSSLNCPDLEQYKQCRNGEWVVYKVPECSANHSILSQESPCRCGVEVFERKEGKGLYCCNNSINKEPCFHCKDSDDGKDYYELGQVKYGDQINEDACSESGVLFEQYCENGQPLQTTYECPDGCEDGACLNSSNKCYPKCEDVGGVCVKKGNGAGEHYERYDGKGTPYECWSRKTKEKCTSCNQNKYSMAFVLVARNESNITEKRVEALRKIKSKFSNDFRVATNELASMNTSYPIVTMVVNQSFLTENNRLLSRKISKRFYEGNPDNFDFISFYTTYKQNGGYRHYTVQNQVKGIGKRIFDDAQKYGSAGRLKGINIMDSINKYLNGVNDLDSNGSTNGLLHETGHQWCCRVGENFVSGKETQLGIIQQNMHFYRGLQSPYDAGTPMGSDRWIPNENSDTYKRINNIGKFQKYHPFQLYFMGLVNRSTMNYDEEFKIYDAGTPGKNFHPKNATFYKTVSIKDIIKALGSRTCDNQISEEPCVECDDTDGGKNYYQKGRVKGEPSSMYGDNVADDYCVNSSLLNEFYLTDDCTIKYEEKQCNCEDGVCVKRNCPDNEPISANAPCRCEDSLFPEGQVKGLYCCDNQISEEPCVECDDTDGGKNYYEKGRVKGEPSSMYGDNVADDYCVNSSLLNEFYLTDDCTIKYEEKQCNCEDGACVREPCQKYGESFWCAEYETYEKECQGQGIAINDTDCSTDEGKEGICVTCEDCVESDDGPNYMEKGNTRGADAYGGNINSTAFYTDECNGDRLKEFYCEDEGSGDFSRYISMENNKCPLGCEDGACVGCKETDDGKDFFNKGTTTGYDVYGENPDQIGRHTDKCDDDRIMEFYCHKFGYISMQNTPCKNTCEDGECVESKCYPKCSDVGGVCVENGAGKHYERYDSKNTSHECWSRESKCNGMSEKQCTSSVICVAEWKESSKGKKFTGCTEATCSDRIKNQKEKTVDFGGPCSEDCTKLKEKRCKDANICEPKYNEKGKGKDFEKCLHATCNDGKKNQGEKFADFGGPCDKDCTQLSKKQCEETETCKKQYKKAGKGKDYEKCVQDTHPQPGSHEPNPPGPEMP